MVCEHRHMKMYAPPSISSEFSTPLQPTDSLQLERFWLCNVDSTYMKQRQMNDVASLFGQISTLSVVFYLITVLL